MEFLPSPAALTLPWLQRALARPELQSFRVSEMKSSHASNAIVQLEPGTPPSLFLKCCRGGKGFVADSEILYYTRDYATLLDAPVPRCYASGLDPATGDYFILLEDLSATHYSNKDIPPTLEHALAVATELARIHAHHWGTSDHGERQIARFLERAKPTLRFLTPKAQAAVDSFSTRPMHVTLLHGDANPTNVLSPKNPDGKTYLIDRQPFEWSIRHFTGVLDLTYMAVPFWETSDRRALELPMLKRYHESLRNFGVRDYSWNDCEADYRGCLAYGLYVAASWMGNEGMRWLWEKQEARTLAALEDWA